MIRFSYCDHFLKISFKSDNLVYFNFQIINFFQHLEHKRIPNNTKHYGIRLFDRRPISANRTVQTEKRTKNVTAGRSAADQHCARPIQFSFFFPFKLFESSTKPGRHNLAFYLCLNCSICTDWPPVKEADSIGFCVVGNSFVFQMLEEIL